MQAWSRNERGTFLGDITGTSQSAQRITGSSMKPVVCGFFWVFLRRGTFEWNVVRTSGAGFLMYVFSLQGYYCRG